MAAGWTLLTWLHQRLWPPAPPNPSGIEAVGHAVLLLPYDPEVAASPLIVPETVKRQLDMVESRAIVIAIGPDAWMEGGRHGTPRAKVGDKVLVSKFCGSIVRGPDDDVQYRMINGRDIYARIVRERKDVRSAEAPRLGFTEVAHG
jgi:co-chaperonin GroES (HSP10)